MPVDPAARIAAVQRGVVTRRQLLDAGLTPRAIEYRLEVGRLHTLHRAVYLVGHTVAPPLARETAALLACGPGSVGSHRTAAGIWEMIEGLPEAVDVTMTRGRRRSRRGIAVHRTDSLAREDIRTREGLPVTSPERTLLDLAVVVPARQLLAAVDAAGARRLLRRDHLHSLLARFPTRRGTAALRAALTAAEGTVIRSGAERRLVELIKRARLPTPRTNERVAGREVDLHWPDHRLVVEVDGFAFHGDRTAFERDRRRDQDLVAAGYRVLRFTWRQITQEPEAVIARLARVL